MNDDDEIMTVGDVARLLKVGPKRVTVWINEGKIPAFRTPGGHRRIRRSDFDAVMRKLNGDNWP